MDQGLCADCLRAPPPWSRAIAALDYDHPWDRLIVALKSSAFSGDADALASLLAAAIPADEAAAVDWVLPVPLSASRLRERGFNQAWEIARRLAAKAGVKAHPALLQRVLDTPLLAGLSPRRREDQLRAAFMVDPALQAGLRGRRVALVDDVMTTGATLASAARVLRQQGADEVVVWVVARTALRGEMSSPDLPGASG